MARLFLDREQQEYQQKKSGAETVTGRFCAKEAVLKALGLPLSLRALREIEIDGRAGLPCVILHGELKQHLAAQGGLIHVSISHEKGRALAVAIWEGEQT